MRVKTNLNWRKWALVSSVLLGCALSVSAAEFTVQTLHFSGKTSPPDHTVEKGAIAIPYVQPKLSADALLAAAINDRLFIAQFGVMAPRQPPSTVGAAQGIVLEGLFKQRFAVRRNDGHVLTLLFDNEFCGAYCEDYKQAFNFDASSGQLISLDSLLTASGRRELGKRVTLGKITQYRAQLAVLGANLTAAKRKKDAVLAQEAQERIDFNTQCLADSRAALKAASGAQDLAYHRFELTASALSLTAGRCSNHSRRGLDDVDEVSISLPNAELNGLLSAYGRAVLLGEAAAIAVQPTNWPFGALLRGSMGNMGNMGGIGDTGANIPITMLLEKDASNTINGRYFYDKVGKPIELTGTQRGQTLVLVESVVGQFDAASKASWRLTLSGDTLSGVWSNAANSKRLAVRLTP